MPSSQFWNSAEMEPKRNNKFVLYINNVKHWLVKSAGRPTPDINTAEHNYLNHKFKFPGNVSWESLDITLVDPISHNAAAVIRDAISQSGYKWMDEGHNITSQDLETISKKKATDALGLVALEQIDAEGNTVDRWELKNAWIKKVDFSELAYEDDGLSDMTLTFEFDYATLEDNGQ